ncbi:MAG: PEP/pyruvate-binding domain-containing protein [Anaerolineae bacterium]
MERACLYFGEVCRTDTPVAGGKGANLGDMAQAGLPVPPGFVICAPAYRRVVECCGLEREIAAVLSTLDRNDTRQLQEAERRIRSLFVDLPIDEALQAEILEKYRALGTDVRVAVRSSATAEDLAGASFAGQQETILNVVGEEALLDAIRRCWSSLYTSQAIFYRRERGFQDARVSMAVVVQKMVNSEKSGVTFTVDPVLRNHYEMVIEAVWGQGEGIVSGALTPDHYKVDRETYEVVYEYVARKEFMFVQDGRGGIVRAAVPPEKVSARVLTDDEIRRLVDLGNRVEAHFGSPQDIEWGIEEGEVYLLQSRPITVLK